MDIVKCSWSGGKDSTCAVMKHIEKGDHVKAVYYVPMLTDEIPLILNEHYNFILETAEFLKSKGVEIFRAEGMTYFDFVMHTVSKGERKGHIFGFPCHLTGCCNFKNYSKEKALNNIDVGKYDYCDIGIAYDEIKRHGQLNCKNRSILVEQGITEKDAYEFCKINGLLSPYYEHDNRDGCLLCYNKNANARNILFNEHPAAFDIVCDMQNAVKKEMYNGFIDLNKTPLRNGKWFIDMTGRVY